MYHTEVNSLRKVTKESEEVPSAKGEIHRRLHKAMLRYHDPKNFAQIREALKRMGREDLIGRGPQHLVPPETADEKRQKAQKGRRGERALTKHTGLPPTFQGRNGKGKSRDGSAVNKSRRNTNGNKQGSDNRKEQASGNTANRNSGKASKANNGGGNNRGRSQKQPSMHKR
jgi:hypothetical protein